MSGPCTRSATTCASWPGQIRRKAQTASREGMALSRNKLSIAFSAQSVSEEPEQWFSGVSPDSLTDSDPRS